MSQPSFTSLIVTYNSAPEIPNLLNDLQTYLPGNKIIVIDNASQDETITRVQVGFPHVQLVQNPRNVGYAKAVNQGFELCDTEYLLLLNPDIRIPSPQLFAALEGCLKPSRQIAAAAPLQFKNGDGKQYLNFTPVGDENGLLILPAKDRIWMPDSGVPAKLLPVKMRGEANGRQWEVRGVPYEILS